MATYSKSKLLTATGDPMFKDDIPTPRGAFLNGHILVFDTPEMASQAAYKLTAEETQNLTLEQARNLSHILHVNNPLARGVGQSFLLGVIGDGVNLNMKIQNKTADKNGKYRLNEKVNNKIQRDFKKWGKAVTTDGQSNWLEATQKILMAVIESGECFIKFNDLPSSPEMRDFGLPFSIEILEGDSCDETVTSYGSADGSFWDQGIRFDKWGRPIEYAFRVMVQGQYETKYFSAKDILHVFRKGQQRPNSRHGWPLLTPALIQLHNVEKYMKTHLNHAIANSGTSTWMTLPWGSGASNQMTQEQMRKLSKPVVGGAVRIIPAGSTITERPMVPANNLEAYVTATIKLVAITAGLSVEYITADGSRTNFGSIKAGNQHCHEKFCEVQQFLTKALDEIVRRFFVTYSLKHAPKSIGDDIDLYEYEWDFKKWPVADELKHVNAVAKKLEMGLISEATAARLLGLNYEHEIKQKVVDRELREANGIPEATPVTANETDPVDTAANTLGSSVAEDQSVNTNRQN